MSTRRDGASARRRGMSARRRPGRPAGDGPGGDEPGSDGPVAGSPPAITGGALGLVSLADRQRPGAGPPLPVTTGTVPSMTGTVLAAAPVTTPVTTGSALAASPVTVLVIAGSGLAVTLVTVPVSAGTVSRNGPGDRGQRARGECRDGPGDGGSVLVAKPVTAGTVLAAAAVMLPAAEAVPTGQRW